MSSRIFTIAVGVLVLAVIVVYLFSFQVRQTETAVKLTFGKESGKIDNPGLFFKWPWPIQSVVKYEKRLYTFETRLEETLTADKQNVTVSLAVGWRIVDPVKFRQRTGRKGDVTRIQKNIDNLVSDKAAVIAKYKLDNLVSTNPEMIKFDVIESEIADQVTAEAMAQFGVAVPLVRIRRLELPEAGAGAVYSRMKEERAKESTKYRSEGKGAAQEIRTRAESVRQRLIARAKADADSIRAEGDAAAAEYYEVFAKNLELAKFLAKIDSLKAILAQRTTLVIDPSTEPFDILVGSVNVDIKNAPAGGK